MKKIHLLMLPLIIAITGCYNREIEQIEKEIETLKGTEIATLSSQISSISTSLGSLEDLSDELVRYISDLEGTSSTLQEGIGQINASMASVRDSLSENLTNAKANVLEQLQGTASNLEEGLVDIETVIANLQQEDSLLDGRITELRSYADSTLAAKSWVEGTFSTIAKQNEIISTVASIKQQIATLDDAIGEVEQQIRDLADRKSELLAETLGEGLNKSVEDLIDAYTDAIAQAKQEVSEAFSAELDKAITDSETKVMTWVNERLNDYCTIAQAEARIKAFEDMIGPLPEGQDLQSEIELFKVSLSDAKDKVTEDYKKWISEAITESEGRISDDINDQITKFRTDVLTPLSTTLENISKDVDALYERLRALDSRVATMEEQSGNILSTISDMEAYHTQIEEYIKEVERALSSADDWQKETLGYLLDQLSSYSTALQTNINTLKAYVGTIPSGASQDNVVDWAKYSFSTVSLQFESYYTISQIDEKVKTITDHIKTSTSEISKHEQKITELSQAIAEAVDTLRTGMKGWVNTQLGAYLTTAQLQSQTDGLSDKLKALFKADDDDILKKISLLQDDIDKAKSDISTQYKEAIDTAIKQEDGYVTKTIREKFSSLNSSLSDIEDKADSLDVELVKLNKQMAAAEGRIQELTDSLANVRETLSELVGDYEGNLKKYLSDLDDSLKEFKDSYDISSQLFTSLWNELNADGGLQSQVNALLALKTNLTAAQSEIKALQDFTSGYSSPDAIKSLMDELDSLIKSCATITDFESAKAEAAKFNDLTSRVETLEASMKSINSQIAALKQYAKCFGDTTVAGVIKTLEAEIKLCCHDTSLTKLSARVSALETSNDSIIKALGIIELDIDTLQTNAKNLLDSAALFNPMLDGIKSNLQQITSDQKTKYQQKSGEITTLSGRVDGIKTDLDSAFRYIDKLIGASAKLGGRLAILDSLKGVFSTKLSYFQGLTKDNGDKITLLQDSVKALTGIYNDVAANLATALTDIAELETNHRKQLDSTNSLKKLIEEITSSLDDYATVKDLSRLNDSIVKLMPYIGKLDSLTTAFATSRTTIDKLQAFLDGYTSSDVLKDTIEAINKRLDDLATNGAASQKSLQDQIDALMTAIYGQSTATEQPSAGSILGKLSAIESRIVEKQFNSISYLPDYQDGVARIDGDGHVTFRFLIKPETIAPLLNSGNCTMKWIPTAMTRSSIGTAFSEVTSVSGSSDGILTYKVKLSSSEITAFEEGASAALFVTLSDGTTFASKYIPVWVKEYFRISTETLSFGNSADSRTFTVHPNDDTWSVRAVESWISVSRTDNQTVTVSVPQYKLSAERSGYVVVTRGDDSRFVKVTQTGISEERYQTLSFNPSSLAFGYAASAQEIIVTSSDEGTDWIIDKNNSTKWLNINDSQKPKVRVSVAQSTWKRSGIIKFTSASNNTYTVNVSQRGGHELKDISPNSVILSADGTKYYQSGTSWGNVSDFKALVGTLDGTSSDWTVTSWPNNIFSQTPSHNSSDPRYMSLPNATALSTWTDKQRTGTITISSPEDNDTKTFTLTQYRPLTVVLPSTTKQKLQKKSSSATFTITVKSDSQWYVKDDYTRGVFDEVVTWTIGDKTKDTGLNNAGETIMTVTNCSSAGLTVAINITDGLSTKSITIKRERDGSTYYKTISIK